MSSIFFRFDRKITPNPAAIGLLSKTSSPLNMSAQKTVARQRGMSGLKQPSLCDSFELLVHSILRGSIDLVGDKVRLTFSASKDGQPDLSVPAG